MENLTEREEEVIALVAEGVSTRGIAERLWITVATVRNHIQKIMGKHQDSGGEHLEDVQTR